MRTLPMKGARARRIDRAVSVRWVDSEGLGGGRSGRIMDGEGGRHGTRRRLCMEAGSLPLPPLPRLRGSASSRTAPSGHDRIPARDDGHGVRIRHRGLRLLLVDRRERFRDPLPRRRGLRTGRRPDSRERSLRPRHASAHGGGRAPDHRAGRGAPGARERSRGGESRPFPSRGRHGSSVLQILSPAFPVETADAVLHVRGRVGKTGGPETGGRVEFRRRADGTVLGGGAIRADGRFLAAIDLASLPAGQPVELVGQAFDALGNGGATASGRITRLAAVEGGLADLVLTPPDGTVTPRRGCGWRGGSRGPRGPTR